MVIPSPTEVTALRSAVDRVIRHFKIAVVDGTEYAKLNPVDVHSLLFIAENPACNASQLAQHLHIVPTTMSAVIDRLVRQGLLIRSRVATNRRIIALALTTAGQALAKAAREIHEDDCRVMLMALTPQERHTFLASLQKIAAAIS